MLFRWCGTIHRAHGACRQMVENRDGVAYCLGCGRTKAEIEGAQAKEADHG